MATSVGAADSNQLVKINSTVQAIGSVNLVVFMINEKAKQEERPILPDDPNTNFLVTHTSLKKEFNRLRSILKITESFSLPIHINGDKDINHYIVDCTLKSETLSTQVQECGEINSNTLGTTDIARNFPFTMLKNRALDRAILDLFSLDFEPVLKAMGADPTKYVYSESEFIPTGKENEKSIGRDKKENAALLTRPHAIVLPNPEEKYVPQRTSAVPENREKREMPESQEEKMFRELRDRPATPQEILTLTNHTFKSVLYDNSPISGMSWKKAAEELVNPSTPPVIQKQIAVAFNRILKADLSKLPDTDEKKISQRALTYLLDSNGCIIFNQPLGRLLVREE